MAWSEVSALADVLGATAVIISLVYLAFQLRDARGSFVANAQQQLGGDFAAFMTTLWADEDVFELWHKAINDHEAMTETEKSRFGMIMFSMFAHFSNVFELAKFDREFLERYASVMDRMLSFTAVQGWWERQSHTYNPDSEFRRYIDQRVKVLRQA